MTIRRLSFFAALAFSQLVAAHQAFASDAGQAQPVQAVQAVPAGPPAPGSLSTDSPVTIYLVSSAFHTDVIVPRAAFDHAPPLIKAAVARADDGPWIILGWGPWWFGRDVVGGPYHRAPVLAAAAMWALMIPQTYSQIRVAALAEPGSAPGEGHARPKPIVITAEGLDRLIARANATFITGPDGGPVLGHNARTAPGVHLYRSKEIYHLAHECNQWAGQLLYAGGVHTTYILDLLPETLDADLKLHGAL